MNLTKSQLLRKIEDFEYISFSKGKIKKSFFKDKLQTYSLKKNKKDISCCDYFINSKILGDYAMFRYCPSGYTPKKKIEPFLNINQILITKKFFYKNVDLIINAYHTGKVNFTNEKNTTFVSIPLVSISNFRKEFFNNPEFSDELGFFLFSGHRELYSRRKNPFKFLTYFFFLTKEGLFGRKFIFDHLKRKLLYKETRQFVNSNFS